MEQRWTLRPANGVPLYLQLLGNLRWAIACGDLTPGHLLPPMKKMAADLGVGLNTLKTVYRSLERDGLIMSRRGAGTMVVLPRPSPGSGGGPGELIRAAVAQALRGGTSHHEVLQALRETERLMALQAGARRLAFVECNREQAEKLALQLAAYLGLPVDGLLLEELAGRARTLPPGAPRYSGVVTTFFHFRDVRDVLAATGLPVMGVVVRTSSEAAARLAALGPNTKLGLVCRDRPDVAGYTTSVLRLAGPEEPPVSACSLDDRKRLEEVVAWADVLAVTPPCRAAVLRLLLASAERTAAADSVAGAGPGAGAAAPGATDGAAATLAEVVPARTKPLIQTHDALDGADLARLRDYFACVV